MKVYWTAVVSLSMALTTALAARAQDIAASSDELARCANWVKETVPADIRIDGSDFCKGIKRNGSPVGWYSIQKRGEQPGSDKVPAKTFCASSGQIGPDWTVAAGYIGTGPDGGELIGNALDGTTSSVATLYSRTPLNFGKTRIPAGFSQLTISHTNSGWQMAIVSEKEKVARTVQLLSDTRQLSATGRELAIGVHYASPRCSDLFNTRELVFTYSGTDLYVCLSPDHIPPVPHQSAAIQ